MSKDAEKISEDTSPDDATAKAPPPGSPDSRPKSMLPPPDPKLNGTQKRGLGVFKRGPGAV